MAEVRYVCDTPEELAVMSSIVPPESEYDRGYKDGMFAAARLLRQRSGHNNGPCATGLRTAAQWLEKEAIRD